ncbi:MAG: oligosaccharide flippase family protein [Polyangiaceae bacterium]|nr:oligosaccharide flippase family protein [Polyangiaceae bacterium]
MSGAQSETESSSGQPSGLAADPNAVARTAGRGGLAIAFAKAYFILAGLLQQILLPRVLGMDGYGALASALSIASISYNPITTTSIQSVSRALSHAAPEHKPFVLRRVMELHLVFGVFAALVFFFVAPFIGESIGAPHIVPGLRFLSLVLFLYSIYTPLIGALNGEKRFLHQAGFDILSATLRTFGLIGGAIWLGKLVYTPDSGATIEGAILGFVITSALVLLGAVYVVGLGSRQGSGFQRASHLRFVVPLLLGQMLFNLLLQSDLTLVRYFAARAATQAGLPASAADSLVGAYRAIQLFGFLPFQLLVALTFVIFPMLARADADADKRKIQTYVQTGMRLTLLVVGLLVSVISGLSGALLRLVFPSPASELGAEALGILSLGLGCFAIFAVMVSVLNSLRQERANIVITLVGLVSVGLGAATFAESAPFGAQLLVRIATGTSLGLLVAALVTALWVQRTVGRVVAPLTLVRTIGVTAITIFAAHLLPATGKLGTVGFCGLVAAGYIVALVITRELSRADLAVLGQVFSRQRPR